MATPNLVLISELQTLTRRDFPVADGTVVPPLNSNALVDGEWLELNSSYALARGAAGVGGIHEANKPSYVVHTERGRYDVQALSKVNVLFMGMFEAETSICAVAGLSVGDPVTVQDVNILGFATRRGLGAKTGAAVLVVGYVTKLPGNGVIRFVHTGFELRA
jgi:hypothetical protein